MDSTNFTTLFGGDESLKNFWSNLAEIEVSARTVARAPIERCAMSCAIVFENYMYPVLLVTKPFNRFQPFPSIRSLKKSRCFA